MQVLVCTHGEEGINRVAKCDYPTVDGLEYLVSWQLPEGKEVTVPRALAERSDVRIVVNHTAGLSNNRNAALDAATATTVLIADDDLRYNADSLRGLMAYHRSHPHTPLVCGHITIGGEKQPTYSSEEFDLANAPRNYYFISCEISFKLKSVRDTGIRFEPLMGVGAPVLKSGEEEALMRSLMREGLTGTCIPLVLADHPGTTTGDRLANDDSFIMTRGALLRIQHPGSWLIHLPVTALRTAKHSRMNCLKVLRLLCRGVRYSRRLTIFN